MTDTEFQRLVLTRLDDFCERIERIEHLLSGNGEPEKGLIVRLDRLEQTEKREEEKASEHRGLFYFVLGSTIVAVLGAIISAVAAFARH